MPRHLGFPNSLERGTKSEVAHKWADWLHNPCELGGPKHFSEGNKIRSGLQVASWLQKYCQVRGHQLKMWG